MHAGGFTETIWHFIGYLHLADSVARTPTFYEGDQWSPLPPDFHDSARELLRGLAFDELVSVPTTIQETLASRPPGSLGQDLSPAGFGALSRPLAPVSPPLKPLPLQADQLGFGMGASPRSATGSTGAAGAVRPAGQAVPGARA